MKELSEALKSKKLVFGSERTIKLLKNDKLSKIFIAKNCNEETVKEIEKYAKLNEVNIIKLEMNNEEVGAFCKKPFSISVLSLEK